eukprot:g1779.t1
MQRRARSSCYRVFTPSALPQNLQSRSFARSRHRPPPRHAGHEADHDPLAWETKQRLSQQDATAAISSLKDYTRDVATKFTIDADLRDVGGAAAASKKGGEEADMGKNASGSPPAEQEADMGMRLRDGGAVQHDTLTPYTDFSGNRFPTLSTAKNWRYFESRGLNRLTPRKFPIFVEPAQRLDPYFREYLFFLHTWDPTRFTVPRIAERYRLKEQTVRKVVADFGENYFLRTQGISSTRRKQIDRGARIAEKKAQAFAVGVGWDQMGDGEDDVHEATDDFDGWKSTQDWVRRQNVEVEMMSAFPSRDKRNPLPKRVDVDLVVAHTPAAKIINWIDPHDKVPF